MRAYLRGLALVSLLLVSTACSGNLTSLEEASGGGSGFFFSEEELASAITIAPPAPPSPSGPTSDTIAADAIAAELQAAGIDMTGVRVSVWPLAGDGGTFLVLNVTEESALSSEGQTGAGDDSQDALFVALVNGKAVKEAAVARFAFRITGQVEADPFEVVFALAMEDIEESVRTGINISDRALVQLKGGPSA